MKITRERKILLVMLMLGGTALLVDRLARPSKSSATVDPESAVESTTPAPVPTPKENHLNRTLSLAQRLRASVGDETSSQSVFVVPSAWTAPVDTGPGMPPPKELSPPKEVPPPEDPITPFIAAHRLDGVMIVGQKRTAIIDGQLIIIGQLVDGFQLISIEPQLTVFQRDGARATLRLKAPVMSRGIPDRPK